MKKLIVSGIVMAMVVMCLAVAASAFTIDDTIKMGLKFENGVLSQGTLTVGTTSTAADGYVNTEDLGFGAATAGAGEIIVTDLAPVAIVAPTGRWSTDLRQKVITPGQCKAFHLLAYVNGGGGGTNVGIKAWMTSTGKVESTDYSVKLYDGTWSVEECLAKGAPITAALLWTAPINSSGATGTPQYTGARFALEGTATHNYTVVICTAVPEPGSMVALFSGLIGLVGFGIRRRK